MFCDAGVQHLVAPSSDHAPILLKCIQEPNRTEAGKKCRHYEVMWERDAALPEVIKVAWESAGIMENLGDVATTLGSMMDSLYGWSRKRFGNVVREINKSRTRLEELMAMNADQRTIRKATAHMNELMYREEMLWMQRSRIAWLREGDRNMEFFHRRARWRARKNQIKLLIDDSGVAQQDHEVMSKMATDYFSNLFTADQTLQAGPVIDLINNRVSEDMNTGLCANWAFESTGAGWFPCPSVPKKLVCHERAGN